MFSTNQPNSDPENKDENKDESVILSSSKYKSVFPNSTEAYPQESTFSAIDQMLENEKIQNKKENWNKINKSVKIQKLHEFAEKYGKEHSIPVKEIKSLKTFFSECLDKNKLQKTKDIVYDKEKGLITSIPSLFFNNTNRAFTLKQMDSKRVSTIKSLTPKRISEKEKEKENENEE
jgi:hypothetical protein